jgi:hypothetical protein
MPKFYRKNKKRIDPRYFLNESVERDDLIDDIREFSKDVAGSRDTYGDIDKLAEMDLQELEVYFRSLTSSMEGSARSWDVEENPEREEEERRFKAGEDNPWKQGPTLDSDELRDMADKMDQSQPGSVGSQFTREQEKQMSDDVEDFIKKINRSIGLMPRELDRLNRVMDGLWDGNLPEEEKPAIAAALKKGDKGLIDLFDIQMS